MSQTTESSATSPWVKHLLDGVFTDFQIRVRGYHFNVHRLVLSGRSRYFERVCGGSFKEACDGYVEIDESPTSIAILVLFMYQSTYSRDDYRCIEKIIENAFSAGSEDACFTSDLHFTLPYDRHAQMFAVAERYEVPSLLTYAASEFEASIQSKEAPLTLNALIDAVTVLYITHRKISDNLRAIVVYWAQNTYHHLAKLPAFETLFITSPSFAWDFAVKYGRASWLYCSVCKEQALLKNCDCGLRGICGQKNCSADNMGAWTCKTCGTAGQLVRDDNLNGVGPNEEDVIGNKELMSDSVNSMSEAVIRGSPGRKRRCS